MIDLYIRLLFLGRSDSPSDSRLRWLAWKNDR